MAREQDGPTGQAFVTRWRGLIREDPRTTGTYLAVLYALADYADSDGTSVHPSQARLARNVGVHVRQIRRYLGRAESEGWVARDGGRGNQHQATEYRLTSAPAPDMGVLSSPEGAEGAEDIHVLSETPAPDMGVLSSPEGAEGAEDIEGPSRGHLASEQRTPMSPHLEDLAIDLANPEIEIHSHTDTFRNAREPGHRNGNDLESDRPPTGSLRIVLAHLPPDVRARVLDDPDALAEARRLCTAIPAPRPDTDAHRGLTAWGGVHGVSPVLKRLRRLARSRGPCERCGAEAGAGRGFRTLPDGRPCPVCLPRKAA